MRRYLSAEMRRRFEVAWRLPPSRIRRCVRPVLRSVRQVDDLGGAKFRCADGSYIRVEGDGGGFCAFDSTTEVPRAAILLSSQLLEGEEPFTIATILHELAHCLMHMDLGYVSTLVQQDAAEAYAWIQAAACGLLSLQVRVCIACCSQLPQSCRART